MTPHRLADTEFHAASSHSVGYGIIYGCMRSEHGSIHKETRGLKEHVLPQIFRQPTAIKRAPTRLFCNRVSYGRDITCLPFEIPTPAPCARRTGRSRTVSLCGKV